MRFKSFTLLATIMLMVGCSDTISQDMQNKIDDNSIRTKGVFSAAFSFGAQSGLAWQSKNIMAVCNDNAKVLDKIYNFNSLLMQHNLLPPVVSEASNSLRLTSNTMRIADKIVEIIKPAHFVSTPPTWRDYLLMDFQNPEEPNNTLLPKTQIERDMWDDAIKKGWDAGVMQANNLLTENLGRLNRDFNGISLYHSLKAQKMITAPTTAKANLGITGDSRRMQINDKILRITSHSNLQYNTPDAWQPALIAKQKVMDHYASRK